MDYRALAVLGRGLVPVDTPLLRADDQGLTRGDGVFETLHVRAGQPWLLGPHLARLAASAAALDLALPPAEALAALVREVVAGSPPQEEAGVKLVCTRGPETGGGPPTVFALLFAVPDALRRQRRDGVRVRTASLGVAADARSGAPWLLPGVKSLSYAVNMAVQRWAVAQGCDDALLLAVDGQVLEGPTSTAVWATDDGVLCTVPTDTGILAGTTAAHLLDHAADLGLRADRQRATVPDLVAARAVWLCSAVRGAAPVRAVDGVALRSDPGIAAGVRGLLGFPG